jgi:hypothetical protein
VPDLIAAAGPRASDAYIEFFTATIRNRNTRLAYARACHQLFHWCQQNGLTLDTVRPFHVAACIEQMPGSKPTIKQKQSLVTIFEGSTGMMNATLTILREETLMRTASLRCC